MPVRQMPVKNPADLIYTGSPRSNAIVGPVSKNGYPAKINEVQSVEREDDEALLETGFWKKPPRTQRQKREEVATDAS